MSADLLREAAALMRERARAANTTAWYVAETLIRGKSLDPVDEVVDAEFIASMSPTVALTVADWLDSEAVAMDALENFSAVTADLVRKESWTVRGAAMTVSQGSDGSLGIRADTSGPALTVARAYLGTTT